MRARLNILFLCVILLGGWTSHPPKAKYKYHFTISFPETEASITDVISNNLYEGQTDGAKIEVFYKLRDINDTLRPIVCKSKITLTSLNDTSKKYHLIYSPDSLGVLKLPALKGDYLLTCLAGNKIVKPYKSRIRLNPDTAKSRMIHLFLGNYNSVYYFEARSEKELTEEEKKLIFKNFNSRIYLKEGVLMKYGSPVIAEWQFLNAKKCEIELLKKKVIKISR